MSRTEHVISKNERPEQDRAWVTAEEWFAGGQRIPYDPAAARVLSDDEAADVPGAVRVFERVAGEQDPAAVWLTLLPGFPDGSYGWAQVDRMLGGDLGPRLYVEPVGQGDSDKPRHYPYSTAERANLVEALWRHHRVGRTVVVTFDYTSLALLELLRRQLERRQLPATRERVGQAQVLTFPGGHLTTSEHPELLAATVRDIAVRHGVGTS
jgi:pimeloyl-ACP methyl ester carboxylesterase